MCREPTASGAEAGGRDGAKRPDDLCITQGFGVILLRFGRGVGLCKNYDKPAAEAT